MITLAEAYTEKSYERQVRSAVRGLWSGALSRDQFVDAMGSTIRRGLTAAFLEGAATWDITEDELSDAEREQLEQLIADENEFVDGLADAIEEGSKEQGGKLDPLLYRASLWVSKYGQVVQQAKALTGSDQKLEWVYDPAKEHCPDCLALHGKVARGSTWERMNLWPRSRRLACRGYHCGCDLLPTKKRVSRFIPEPTHAAELQAQIAAELTRLVQAGVTPAVALEQAVSTCAPGLRGL